MTGLIPSRMRNIAIAAPPGPPPIISTSVFIIHYKIWNFRAMGHCRIFGAGKECWLPLLYFQFVRRPSFTRELSNLLCNATCKGEILTFLKNWMDTVLYATVLSC